MTRTLATTVALALGLTAALSASSAMAQGVRDGQVGGDVGMRSVPPRLVQRGSPASPVSPGHPHDPQSSRYGKGHARPGGTYGVPIWYASPPDYYEQPTADYPPEAYDPGAADDPPAAIAQMPSSYTSVIEYETGRYVLRGDGITMPYTWVWIPNPPPGPPAAVPPPPPAAPPLPSAQVSATPKADEPEAVPTEIYRWTDAQGVVTLTDRWDSIPERYRGQVRRVSH